jgi:hypothetical protein
MHLRKRYVIAVFLFGIYAGARAQEMPRGVGAREVALYAQLLAMTDTRRLDTALVDRALASNWAPMRSAATLAIGQVGAEPGLAGASRSFASSLRGFCNGRANAAYALAAPRHRCDLRPAAGLAPITGLRGKRHGPGIGAPARTAITTGLKTDREHDTAIQLLLAASKLRPVPLAEIRPYLAASHPSVVWAASYAIARTRTPGGLRDLIDLEASPALRARPQNPERAFEMASPYVDSLTGNQRTRAEIARGLAKSAAGDSLGPKAFAVLARLVGDVDPHVRVNAVRSLGTYGALAKASIIYATHDNDPNADRRRSKLWNRSSKDTAGAEVCGWPTSLVYRSSLLHRDGVVCVPLNLRSGQRVTTGASGPPLLGGRRTLTGTVCARASRPT